MNIMTLHTCNNKLNQKVNNKDGQSISYINDVQGQTCKETKKWEKQIKEVWNA